MEVNSIARALFMSVFFLGFHGGQSGSCPDLQKIRPCTCDSEIIMCAPSNGLDVTQETIDTLFVQLRSANNLTISQLLDMNQQFGISSESLTSLDLTPLLNSRFEALGIFNSSKLSRVHGPLSASSSSAESTLATIHIEQLAVFDTQINDEGFSDFFHYLDPKLHDVQLNANGIRGPNPNASEFFPGISTLTGLRYFYLDENRIENLTGGAPFKNMSGVTILDLSYNKMRSVGENALFVLDRDAIFNGRSIYLWHNLLNDDSFHVNHGLDSITNASTILDLNNNLFEFISQEKWESFLKANPENYINLRDNPIVCDGRMEWVKKGGYQNRVDGTGCW